MRDAVEGAAPTTAERLNNGPAVDELDRQVGPLQQPFAGGLRLQLDQGPVRDRCIVVNLQHLPVAGDRSGCAACDPTKVKRGSRRLPRLDLQQPQPVRAALGSLEWRAIATRIATRYEKTS
jgi:hypothetical protein